MFHCYFQCFPCNENPGVNGPNRNLATSSAMPYNVSNPSYAFFKLKTAVTATREPADAPAYRFTRFMARKSMEGFHNHLQLVTRNYFYLD